MPVRGQRVSSPSRRQCVAPRKPWAPSGMCPAACRPKSGYSAARYGTCGNGWATIISALACCAPSSESVSPVATTTMAHSIRAAGQCPPLLQQPLYAHDAILSRRVPPLLPAPSAVSSHNIRSPDTACRSSREQVHQRGSGLSIVASRATAVRTMARSWRVGVTRREACLTASPALDNIWHRRPRTGSWRGAGNPSVSLRYQRYSHTTRQTAYNS